MLGFLLLVSCAPDPEPDICEEAFLRQEAAVRACGARVELERWTGEACSTEEELLLSCEADCMEAADCVALADGSRSEASGSYGAWDNYAFCISNCPTPW